jgi:hypothetical protein
VTWRPLESQVLPGVRTLGDEVRRHVPADRLLEFKVTDGWEPLCRFLGIDVTHGSSRRRRSVLWARPQTQEPEADSS